MEVRLGEKVGAIPKAEWNALLGADDTPFVTWEWLASLEDAKCVGSGTGWLPRPFLLYEDDVLIAAAPAYIKGHSEGEFVFDWSWADAASRIGEEYFPKLIFAVPFTPANGTRVLCMDPAKRGEYARIMATAARKVVEEAGLSSAHVLFPTELERDAFVEAGYLPRCGVQFHFQNPGYRDFEDFLSTLPTKKRTQVRRERKEPERQGVRIETVAGTELREMHAESMHRFYAATVDKFHYGRRYLNRRFFDLLTMRMPQNLAWVFALRNGTPIAGAFNIASERALYGRYWGADEELAFLHFNVCYYHGVDECIRAGRSLFEPGAGGEHKRARGFRPTMTYSAHFISSSKLRSLVAPFLRREGEAIRAHIAQESGED